MALPVKVTWDVVLPFLGSVAAIGIFSFIYMRRYRSPYETNVSSFLTTIFSLFVILITTALSPIDIFIASEMKYTNGSFKEWAASNITRNEIEQNVLYGYYSLYAVVFLCIFFIIPFMYFYFEETDEDFEDDNRCCGAFKYTMIFVVIAVALLLTGAFVPLQAAPPANSTEWDKIKIMFDKLGENKGEDAISMVLSVLSSIGIINLIFYTGFGISSWPIGLIRGQKSAKKQYEEIQDRHLINQSRINALKEKQRIVGRLNPKDLQMLNRLETEERGNLQRESLVGLHRNSIFYKFRYMLRPIEIILGICGLVLSILIWLSLLLTNIDKALHSPGYKMGYMLSKRTLFNPLDYVLVNLQIVFPLDYVIFLTITWFLILCTMSGIRNLGIRIFFIKMYKLRPKRTPPQGLLLTCAILMMTTLAINILFFCISPEYVSFGNQYYLNYTNSSNQTIASAAFGPVESRQFELTPLTGVSADGDYTVIQCNNQADDSQCTMTRSSYLLLRFLYRAWYFGVFYYFASWFFLLLTLSGFIYALSRKSRAVTDAISDEEDFEESDDDFRTPRQYGSDRNNRAI